MVSHFSLSQFSCEKQKKVAPSEAVPGFLDVVTTRYYNFYISAFFPKYLLILLNATKKSMRNRPLYRTIRWRRWRLAHLVRHHAEPQRGLRGSRRKVYWRVAGVSTRRFDEVATKKARAITSKTHLLSPGALSRCT